MNQYLWNISNRIHSVKFLFFCIIHSSNIFWLERLVNAYLRIIGIKHFHLWSKAFLYPALVVISISMHNTKPEGIAGNHADNSLGNTGKQSFYAKAWKSTIIWYYEISKHILWVKSTQSLQAWRFIPYVFGRELQVKKQQKDLWQMRSLDS